MPARSRTGRAKDISETSACPQHRSSCIDNGRLTGDPIRVPLSRVPRETHRVSTARDPQGRGTGFHRRIARLPIRVAAGSRRASLSYMAAAATARCVRGLGRSRGRNREGRRLGSRTGRLACDAACPGRFGVRGCLPQKSVQPSKKRRLVLLGNLHQPHFSIVRTHCVRPRPGRLRSFRLDDALLQNDRFWACRLSAMGIDSGHST